MREEEERSPMADTAARPVMITVDAYKTIFFEGQIATSQNYNIRVMVLVGVSSRLVKLVKVDFVS